MRRASPWLVVGWLLSGCGELIGVEDAHYDPSLEPNDEKSVDGGDAGSATEAESACERYCDEVMAACQGDVSQYPNHETCLAVCATLPWGSAGDSGNSLACRSRQVELAVIEPRVHCAFAGPGGGGECGSNCEGLCSIATAICSAERSGRYYADFETCLAECEGLPDLGGYGTAEGFTEGGHVQCRLYHVTAATQDAARHCPHVLGEAPCVSE